MTTSTAVGRETYIDRFASFFKAYLKALVWQAPEQDDEDGEPVDGIQEIASRAKAQFDPESLGSQLVEAATFFGAHQAVIAGLDYGTRGEQWTNDELAGHDFALTRNRHGAGFWDRGLGEVGDMLTAESHAFGEVDLFAIDNTIYFE